MAIRILLALLAVAGIMWYLAWYHRASPADRNQSLRTALLYGTGIALLLLVVTGRIPWLFAIFSAAVPWINRAMSARRLWQRVRNEPPAGGQHGPGGAQQPPRSINTMSRDEAFQVLGLSPEASRQEIIDAHRKLMSRIHPDKGGSDYLAQSINHAREVLLADDPKNGNNTA